MQGQVDAGIAIKTQDGLTPDQQLMFLGLYPGEVSALPNKWGQRGWTVLHLDRCEPATARHAIETAWRNVVPQKHLDNLT